MGLKISEKRWGNSQSLMSTRLPDGMIEEIERIAKETGRARNEIVRILLEYALDNIEIEKK